MSTFPKSLHSLQRSLVEAESKLRLIDSLLPHNFRAERQRLEDSYRHGRAAVPEFRFGDEHERQERATLVSATLSAARIVISGLSSDDAVQSEMAALLTERLDELELEVTMLRQCGRPGFAELAQRRFGLTEVDLETGEALAKVWIGAEDGPESDTRRVLLASAFEHKLRALGPLGKRCVVMERELASLCAVGGAHLYVRKGARVSVLEAERLWVHEVEGHLLPRLRADTVPPPFLIGTAGCATDEEGWAVWLEEKRGLLGPRRKRELALRFRLALAFRRSGVAGLLGEVNRALDDEVEAEALAGTVCRLLRGGGLARESIYLPAYLRVKRVLDGESSLAHYFEMGRASVGALPRLSKLFPTENRTR